MDKTDVFLSGGGIAGLAAAAGLAHAGFSVVLADPAEPPEAPEDPASDLRSTAFLRPARRLFERAGLWQALAPHATPLHVLRAVDTTGWPPIVRATRTFAASDLGDEPFGWNLPNWLTRAALARALTATPGVDLRFGIGFAALLAREREVRITLTDGNRIAARLAVAADGRASPLREAAGIGVRTTRYGQTALAFAVSHDLAHENVSTEIYNDGGAFVLVPLPDHDGRPASSVVWMDHSAPTQQLMAMDRAAFAAEATTRAGALMGPFRLETGLRAWPVVTQQARRLTARRVAVLAEAAHVLPPIGAQGLNASLADVACLIELAATAPEALGNGAMLDRYARTRAADLRARAGVIDLFNRLAMSGDPAIQSLRRAGLQTIHGIAPLRRSVMRAGLGGR